MSDLIKMDAYATHMPLLAACVARTDGPVLELGCGMYSTPLIHAICGDARSVLSLEFDREWLARFQKLNRGNHDMRAVDDWADAVRQAADIHWSVVLVDQQPAAARAPSITLLRQSVDLFVCHDSEHRLYNYEPVLETFLRRKEWRRYAPWTSVVSDTMDLSFLDALL